MSKTKQLMTSISRERPSVSLDAKTLPAIKDWKVGKKYKIILDVEQVSLSKDEWDDGDNQVRARFRINSAKECDE